MSLPESTFLNHCKKLIEQKFLDQAGITNWKQKELEYLSSEIENQSGIVLSISTLKRIWKKDFKGTPHTTTLNALVSVLGFQNWWEFKSSVSIELLEEVPRKENKLPAKTLLNWLVAPIILGLLIVILGPTVRSSIQNSLIIPEHVPFTYQKTVDSGVPATVIFDYDVSGINGDSFFIQQSWNELHREPIDPLNKTYSSIYYMPGYHKAKLVVNDSIIKINPVHVKTDGWMSYIIYSYDQKVPIYLREGPVYENGTLTTPLKMLQESHVNLDQSFITNYINVRDLEALSSNNFIAEARLKCEESPAVACPNMQLVIHTEKHLFYIPITTIGCVHNNQVKIGETYLFGRNTDLSKFSGNVFEWQQIKLIVKDKKGDIYLNDEWIETISFEEDHGEIVGLNCRFIGSGSVDYILLSELDGQVVFVDGFDLY